MIDLFYISTNSMWSGSEELWSRSAKTFIDAGYSVCVATVYDHEKLDELKVKRLNFLNRFVPKPFLKRGIERFLPIKFETKDSLKDLLLEAKPQLVIISQGNIYESIDVINLCKYLNFPYITLTQLVSDLFIWVGKNEHVFTFREVYRNAKKNFFVSHSNLKLNNFILGCDLLNAEVVYNPCKLLNDELPAFSKISGFYTIGLVGRIECWHKGYDLLVQVLSEDKWKKRPIQFNMYGDGPHTEFIKTYISKWELKNLVLKGHSNHIGEVWSENQILLMPSRFEGQALALIEAMWCQRAAIVTDVGGASELIEEGVSGFIADAPTIASIDAALERAWEKRDEWQQMGIKAAASLREKHPADAVEYFNQQLLKLL
ncbi:glycosyltransferase [Hymenobacter profundi]|uniref:Glycosyltransferase n=1 Tax=Hymenobacter profundi TaxID=1982110 RepID=A0ABS6WVD9_9BACT|nr:glycosyltransferase [Hymenobacter profundi]MBW3127591.1 glycosyltransferase [Hymenobacter profundi]